MVLILIYEADVETISRIKRNAISFADEDTST